MQTNIALRNSILQLFAFLFLASLTGCKSGTETTSVTDSVQTEVINDEPTMEETDFAYEGEGGFDAPRGIIAYEGVEQNEKEHDLRTFQRLQDVLDIAQKAMALRDSLLSARGADNEGGPLDDSIRATQSFQDAWQALDEYKRIMEPGYTFEDGIPGLIDLTRTVGPADSTEHYLPSPGNSSFLARRDYFFMGGAPFIDRIQSDEGGAFESPDGKLEMRFESSVTGNANYILNFLLHMEKLPMKITYGPPLRMYDGWSRHVNDVGSIIHTFSKRVPAFFLTTKGAIAAEVISIAVKLDGEGLGCVSDQPLATFACNENISSQDILGVYISNADQEITFKHHVHSNALWTADLNDDGIADLACVSSSFEGISSDSMAELLWFVNVNGEWRIIDYAQMLDCT